MPNIEALTKWVKLRGLQGLQGKRAIRKMAGPTTAGQAMKVAKHLKQHEVRGTRAKGRHTPVDAAELVAWAIAQTVQKEGTKPHWFVRNALPEIEAILRAQMKAHLKK